MSAPLEMSLGAQLSPLQPGSGQAAAVEEHKQPVSRPLGDDDESALFHAAQKAFMDNRLKDAMDALQKLKVAAATGDREDDVNPGIAVNHLVVRRASGEIGIGEAMTELEVVYKRAKESGDFDLVENAALVYNLALAYFLRRQFLAAESLLKSLYLAVTSSVAGSASPSGSRASPSHQKNQQQQHEELLYGHVLPLLTTLANELHQPTVALAYLVELEKGSSSKSKGALMTLQRAQAFVNARQHKQFKKDVKSTGLGTQDCISFEFMRANLEYLKGNHKKAVKLLLMAVQSRNTSDQAQQQQTIESLNASDPYVMSLYHNNLGCIHMATGKPNAARYTFNDAINLHNAAIRDDSAGLLAARKDYMLRLKNCELVYNLGVNLLHIGQHRESFDTLMRTSSLLAKSSHLWLHLAECCIAHNSEKRDGFKELVAVPPAAVSKKQRGQQQYQQDTDAANVTFMLEGASAHQKIILVRQQTGGQQQQRQKKQQEEEEDNKNKNSIRKKRVPSHHPDLTMEFAHHCLENAAYNLDAWSGNRPNPLPITSRPIVLRAAILLKQSYVALCLDNPTVAYRHSKRLLDLANNSNGSSVPAGHKVLGRLYCGEALVLLDRISEAADYLDPLTVQDVSFEDARNADDPGPTGSNVGVSGGSASGGNSNRHAATTASEMIAARALFSYNLAVAFLIRGEIERAGEMLEALAGQANQHKMSDLVFMARLYVLIKKGKLAECRKVVRRQATLRTKTN